MTLILIVFPSKDKQYYNADTAVESSSSASGLFEQKVDNWFSEKVPQNNPIASSIYNSQATKPNAQPLQISSSSIDTPQNSNIYNEEQFVSDTPTLSQQQTDSGNKRSSQSSESVSKDIFDSEVIPIISDDEIVYNKNGNVIVGTRGFSIYSAGTFNCENYANVLNKYKAALPNVNVYSLVIPTACEFYSPPDIAANCTSQLAHINEIYRNLANVTSIDAYSQLKNHADEDIYLRTDHHWAPLGGYYAAKAFAEAANVPFLPLSEYTKHINSGFVGTMYGYTDKNETLKNNPEDFVYYTPNSVDYITTYYNYKLTDGVVSGVYEPMKAAFFLDYGNNASDNYCTFMGGDAKIVHVKTNTKNGRRLAIFKDSFGNTIPGYLFGSFEEIYVLDLRYFSHNAVDFMNENNITDLLFANNTTITASSSMTAKLEKLLTQQDMGF